MGEVKDDVEKINIGKHQSIPIPVNPFPVGPIPSDDPFYKPYEINCGDK